MSHFIISIFILQTLLYRRLNHRDRRRDMIFWRFCWMIISYFDVFAFYLRNVNIHVKPLSCYHMDIPSFLFSVLSELCVLLIGLNKLSVLRLQVSCQHLLRNVVQSQNWSNPSELRTTRSEVINAVSVAGDRTVISNPDYSIQGKYLVSPLLDQAL